MNADSGSQNKKKLCEMIRVVKVVAKDAKARAQRTVQDSHRIECVAELAEDYLVNIIPSDASLPKETWKDWTASWDDTANRLRCASQIALQTGFTAATTAVSTSDMFHADLSLPLEKQEHAKELERRFVKLVQVTEWDEDLEAEFVRLGSACPHALDRFRVGIRWNRRHG